MVTSLKIKNTHFPDVDEIVINKLKRQAEIKFVTSDFKYHNERKTKDRFEQFMNNNGCIIVLNHDNLPSDFPNEYPIDVFEIDKNDFSAFVRENFDRFYHRQLNSKQKNSPAKIWLTSQSENFHGINYKRNKKGNYSIPPAKCSKIWSPIYRSQINEIDVNDKVVFVKFNGVDKQHAINGGNINPKWLLTQLYISRVKSIETREEYCKRNNLEIDSQLWINDRKKYTHVFVFEKLVELNLKIYINKLPFAIINILHEVYSQPGMLEISVDQYILLLEKSFEVYESTVNEINETLIENNINLYNYSNNTHTIQRSSYS
ncbi:hypothetical protein BHF71_10135 [Vulcanibacillus modesticaldus]|uniref:Uncharacterized protein n=1 Tax=Vulcanibacillus modesticaldus TaxID=337097 RepID=A0A1D2YU00_9BACI|nr:hypothetical protein [Vulcanibacillus modesticaldus]OEF99125.1 hypothetical protein BHF71_10135 [Vulcanibacillus modesticaldus]